jgi:hypothetical protein
MGYFGHIGSAVSAAVHVARRRARISVIVVVAACAASLAGDVKGGRYVSGVVDLYVGTGPAS